MPLDNHGGANLRTYASYTFQGALSSVEVPKDVGANKYYAFDHSGDYQTDTKGGWNGRGGIGLHGTTGEGSVMNPYQTVYYWLRTA